MSLSISLFVKPSRYLLLLSMAISVFAFSILIIIGAYYFVSMIFFCFIVLVIGAWIFIFRILRSWSLQSYRLEVNADGEVVIRELDVDFEVANSILAFLCSPIIVLPQLIVLNLIDENEKPRKVLIASDSVGVDDFRRLKVIALFWVRRMQHIESVNRLSDGNF